MQASWVVEMRPRMQDQRMGRSQAMVRRIMVTLATGLILTDAALAASVQTTPVSK